MDLISWLCGELGVDKCVLISSRREPDLLAKKRVVIKVLRTLGWSYPKIGKALNRHHTSILHDEKKLKYLERLLAEELVRGIGEIESRCAK